MPSIPIFSYASGVAANDTGCALGPSKVHEAVNLNPKLIPWFNWAKVYQPISNQKSQLQTVVTLCTDLAHDIQACAPKQFFVVLGGDHSCAIGTWSGVKASLASTQRLGLIWIDAHLDSHTFSTTISGNIHGMPAAALLGQGEKALTALLNQSPILDPRDLFFIGIRSYESEEMELIQKLGARVYTSNEVNVRGLKEIFSEISDYFSRQNLCFGLSVDIDAFDPQEAPGVGTPAPDGLHADPYFSALSQLINQPSLCGIELVEFNPMHDQENKTCHLILRHLELIGQLRSDA